MLKPKTCLLRAIAVDVVESVYEFNDPKSTELALFGPGSRVTDDSVLTLAIADAILKQRAYRDCIREYVRAFPGMGKGGLFRYWIYAGDRHPYNSFGNGTAMLYSLDGMPIPWLPSAGRSRKHFSEEYPQR